MDVRIGKFKVRDGTELHYEHWTPPKFNKALVLVHGVGDHCGRYGPFVDYFSKNGYKVCLYDQRGHGKSEGKRAHIEKFEIFYDDLEQYIFFSQHGTSNIEHGTNLPWFLVGHSFGGQIILNFLARWPVLFKAACASSPNIEIALTMPKWQEKLGKMLLDVWPTMKLKGLVDPALLSHDPKVGPAFVKDPLVSPFVTIGIGNEILSNLETIFSLAPRIQTPLLLLHGSADGYCSPEGTRKFFNELVLAQKELKIYEGMYHELFNEVGKEKVFHDIDHWFQRFS